MDNKYEFDSEYAELESLFNKRDNSKNNEKDVYNKVLEEVKRNNIRKEDFRKGLDYTSYTASGRDDVERITEKNWEKKNRNNMSSTFSKEKIPRKVKKRISTRKKVLIGVGTGALISLYILANTKLGIDLKDRINFHINLKSAKNILCDNMENNLNKSGIDIDNNIDVLDKIDYSKFIGTNISELELYGYYELLGEEAAEKIVTSMKAIEDESGYYSGYSDFNNYLIRLGYYDENKQPSYEVWENYMEARLVEEYKNGSLEFNQGGKTK